MTMNYELTFLFDCVVDSVPMKAYEIMIIRKLDDEVISLINDNWAVITKVIK